MKNEKNEKNESRYPDEGNKEQLAWRIVNTFNRYGASDIPTNLDLWPQISKQLQLQRAVPKKFNPKRPMLRLSPLLIALAVLLCFSAATYGLTPLLSRLFEAEAGTNYIFQRGLGTELNLSQTRGIYTIKLERAYADAHRIILGVSIQGVDTTQDVFLKFNELRDEFGNSFRPTVGMGNGEKKTAAQILYFENNNQVKGNPGEIKLHASIAPFVYNRADVRTYPFEKTELEVVEFDFSVPYHPARVVEVNKTVVDKGVTMTLEKLLITPSATSLYMRATQPPTGEISVTNWAVMVELKTPQDTLEAMNDGPPFNIFPHPTTQELAWHVFYPSPLSEKYGEWNVRVTEIVGLPLGQSATPVIDSSCVITDPQPKPSCVATSSAEPPRVRIKGNWNFKFNYSK